MTTAYPNQTATIGIRWCGDGRSFVSHSRILADTLQLKQNSLNRNFRDHGFVIKRCPCDSIMKDFPDCLFPDEHNWKKRTCACGEFTRETTLEEAAQMSIRKTAKPGTVDSARTRPVIQSSLARLCPPGSVWESDVLSILADTDGTDSWKDQMLETAVNDWISAFGCVDRAGLDPFVQSVVRGVTLSQPYDQLFANVSAVLYWCSHRTSEGVGVVMFLDYWLLMLRFGPMSRFLRSVGQMSRSRSFDFSFTVEEDFQNPDFHPWFHPELTDAAAIRLLELSPSAAWLVRPSSIPNCFTLHYNRGTNQYSSRIRYDGLAPDDQMLSIEWDEGDVRSANSWNSLLFGIIGLEIAHVVRAPIEGHTRAATLVTGSKVAAGAREEHLAELELRRTDTPECFQDSILD
jgi:hypothetical protein